MIQEGNILLRRLNNNDAPVLSQLANNRKIWLNLRDLFPFPYSLDDAYRFISITQQEDPPMSFAIEYEQQFCGIVGLVGQSDVYKRTAEIGYWIGEPYWNKGIATIAIKLITAYGFDQLDYIRIHAGIFEYNIGSMKVLTKNGYEKDGVFKRSILKDGKIYDEHRFSKTK